MKTILITGVSSGLGRAIAQEALARGHRVVGTLRDAAQCDAFEALAPGQAFARLLDVTHTNEMPLLVECIEAKVGPIDVLVNNAGYGLRGMVEELDLAALRQQFEVNVFGPVALAQAVLPAMRKRRAGLIVNMVSMGGMVAFPGLGAYHGTKFALLGLNDSLAQEVAPLGVRVIAVLPGVYRSDWTGRSQAHAATRIEEYAPLHEARDRSSAALPWGDPAALARAVVDAIEMETPPAHLLVGPVALRNVRQRLADWSEEIDRWENLSEAGGEG